MVTALNNEISKCQTRFAERVKEYLAERLLPTLPPAEDEEAALDVTLEWTHYDDPCGRWWRLLKRPKGHVAFFVSEAYPWTKYTRAGATIVVVPGISALADPLRALAAACQHLQCDPTTA
ncbi:MAG: hypothetical protein Q8P18_18290 [Pseudomonadota bacterium]|nr:hypothetical protein [Pseudomonadota bacterium]